MPNALRTSTVVRAFVVVALLFTAGAAGADPTHTTTDRAPQSPAGDYSYTFTDDPLNAPGLDFHDTRWILRVAGYRATLVRPRTQFVSELLKSVEAL
jgi:hypothetical protein